MALTKEMTRLKNLIRQIELATTFDALGFFKIELSTLTSLGSTILTYLIILAQFTITPPPIVQLVTEINPTQNIPSQ